MFFFGAPLTIFFYENKSYTNYNFTFEELNNIYELSCPQDNYINLLLECNNKLIKSEFENFLLKREIYIENKKLKQELNCEIKSIKNYKI